MTIQYILNNENEVVAIYNNDQDVISLYPECRSYFTGERHEVGDKVKIPSDYGADFEAACALFRAICATIGQKIGVEDFRGGFDEMEVANNTGLLDDMEGVKLAFAWTGANESCKHEGKKLGLNSPQWWYKCWEDINT